MPVSCYAKALREPVFFLWECRSGPKGKAAQYRSKAAIGRRHGKGDLVYDHAVPFVLLQAELLALQPVTEESIERVLSRFGTPVLITREENDHLNRLGYGRSMPADWNRADPLARYNAAASSSSRTHYPASCGCGVCNCRCQADRRTGAPHSHPFDPLAAEPDVCDTSTARLAGRYGRCDGPNVVIASLIHPMGGPRFPFNRRHA